MPLRRLSLSFACALTGLVLLVPFSAHAQTGPPNAKPTGTISGKVTVSEKAVADILVAAQSMDRPMQQPVARAKSDAGGRYSLTGLPAGQYQITAIAPGLAATEQSGYFGSFYGSGKAVVLASGEEADDVDIKLVHGAVITGRVTDADGKPVIEEPINLQKVDQASNAHNQASGGIWNYQMSQTDDRGIYRIYGLSAGRYRVSVGSNEGAFMMMSRNHTYYPLTFHGNTTDAAKASIVELQDGTEATNIDIRVGRAASTFIASGRLIDAETGQPIPGVRLAYGQAQPNQPFRAGFVGSATNASGAFRLEGLQPGRYGVTAASSESATHYTDPLLFEIADADVTNLELKATRGLTLSGVVVFEGSRAKELQKHIGTLRVGASVTSLANPPNHTSSSSAIAADGSFQLSGIRPGKARLNIGGVYSPALRGITILRAERGGVDVTQNLEIQAGESINDLRIVATLGAGSIRGTVRFVGGEPPPNVRLFVNVQREGTNSGGGATVDTRGRFAIANLAAGTYSITLNGNLSPASRNGIAQTQTVNVTDDGETEITFIVEVRPPEGRP